MSKNINVNMEDEVYTEILKSSIKELMDRGIKLSFYVDSRLTPLVSPEEARPNRIYHVIPKIKGWREIPAYIRNGTVSPLESLRFERYSPTFGGRDEAVFTTSEGDVRVPFYKLNKFMRNI